jgi:hypothetical protein
MATINSSRGTEQLLRTDLIVTLTPTGCGSDIGDSDVIAVVKSEDLYGAQVS